MIFAILNGEEGADMFAERVYYEPDALKYELGKVLKDKFADAEWIAIQSHNNIEELRKQPNSEFSHMKQFLVVGVRKTHKYVPNEKSSDFLVPYTSSGCSAKCLYCYLVCHYNKCAYLRLFVNREQMLDKLIRTSQGSERELTFEIGSNSDLVLENTITGNLEWTIERFAKEGRGHITFPTKFSMIEPLLNLDHRGRTVIRMSVNPQEIISDIELGTSPLDRRIDTLNRLCDAGYPVGLLIAPVILVESWKEKYLELLDILADRLSEKVKQSFFIEIILMTYSFVHRAINVEAFPDSPVLYSQEQMIGRGMGKYCYRPELRSEAEEFFLAEIGKRFGESKILYIS